MGKLFCQSLSITIFLSIHLEDSIMNLDAASKGLLQPPPQAASVTLH
jgi:hypothetical protein